MPSYFDGTDCYHAFKFATGPAEEVHRLVNVSNYPRLARS